MKTKITLESNRSISIEVLGSDYITVSDNDGAIALRQKEASELADILKIFALTGRLPAAREGE